MRALAFMLSLWCAGTTAQKGMFLGKTEQLLQRCQNWAAQCLRVLQRHGEKRAAGKRWFAGLLLLDSERVGWAHVT